MLSWLLSLFRPKQQARVISAADLGTVWTPDGPKPLDLSGVKLGTLDASKIRAGTAFDDTSHE